ncbi:hypothetical protein V5O48_007332 [Marasmius crinis-equi]|uniref:F-box domain-containing protein n=1 Tax=Marasmius crinis-equi TaxID=585013 RepID=A0ABR3FH04_9AGAR
MSSAPSTSTAMPIELVEKIISLLWLSPLTTCERALFIKSSVVVSSSWHSIFLRVAATDFYVLSPSHGLVFLEITRGRRTSTAINYPLDTLCRSLTIESENDHLLPGPEMQEQQPIGIVFGAIIQELSRFATRLPYLRRISFEVKNYLMETVFERNQSLLACFPKQVTELEINFTYGEDTDPLNVLAIKSRGFETFGLQKAQSAGLKKLTVLGTSSGVVKELLGVFGGREKLEEFRQDAWKEVAQPIVTATQEEEEENDEVFYDSETGLEPSIPGTDDSWAGSEEMLVESFSKDDLTRMLFALHKGMVVS